MATRFGGVVKAVLTAVDGRSFLEAKLVQTAALESALGGTVPVALMTSFATDDAVRAHEVERQLGDPLVFSQFVSCGSRPGAFRDGGALSLCAGAR
jgi:UDP-N-acetylglucosamine pyrophosphorylase